MKTAYKHISLLFVTLCSLTSTSCMQDDFDNARWEEGSIKNNRDSYIAIRLKGAIPGSRATFEDGGLVDESSEKEHEIGSTGNYAIFFKADKSFDKIVNLNTADNKMSHEELDEVGDGNDKEARYWVKYEVPEDFEVPDDPNNNIDEKLLGYCLIVLNGSPIAEKLENIESPDFEAINNIIWEDSNPLQIGRQGELFTMSNSTFIGENGLQGAQPFKYSVIQDDSEKFDWDPGKVITVYVERLSAKFSCDFKIKNEIVSEQDESQSFPEIVYAPTDSQGNPIDNHIRVFTHFDDDGIPQFDSEKFQYMVKVTGWGMNAIEKKTHLFKKVNENSNYFPDWSNDNYRTHWTEDPDYAITEYPLQYRHAYDRAANNSEFFNAYSKNKKNILRNYSYNEIVGIDNFKNKYQYIPENTYDYSNKTLKTNLGSRLDVLAGTHLIVTAELLTNISINEDGEVVKADGFYPNDLYRDRLGNFYGKEKDCFKVLVSRFNNAIQSNYEMKFKVYDWDLDNEGIELEENGSQIIAYSRGDFKLYHLGNELTFQYIDENWDKYFAGCLQSAKIQNGDGKCMILVDGLTVEDKSQGEDSKMKIITELKFKENGDDNPIYRGCTTEDYEYIDGNKNKTTFTKVVERDPAKENMTNNERRSLIFEWIGPIDHFNLGKMYYFEPVIHNQYNLTENSISTTNNIYGVVRNHWYQYEIIGVNDIGTSVENMEEPIVPNLVPTIDRLNFDVEILDWHTPLDVTAPIIQ